MGNLTSLIEVSYGEDSFYQKLKAAYLKTFPDTNKISAGNNIGQIYAFCETMNKGDIVFMPMQKGGSSYLIGEVEGNYYYDADAKTDDYLNCRTVKWLKKISKEAISLEFRHAISTPRTLTNINGYAAEIESVLSSGQKDRILTAIVKEDGEPVEDAVNFALEKHLEDFIIDNWHKTELGRKYDLYKEDEDVIGQQYQTEAGTIDILAKSKDGKELLIIELKKEEPAIKLSVKLCVISVLLSKT